MDGTEYIELYQEISGHFVAKMAYIEYTTTNIISLYFCPNDTRKQHLFWALIRDKVRSFEALREVLGFIIETEHKDFLEKHPKLISDMKEMQDTRNAFAHSYCAVPAGSEKLKRSEIKTLILRKLRKYNSNNFDETPIQEIEYNVTTHHIDIQTLNNILLSLAELLLQYIKSETVIPRL